MSEYQQIVGGAGVGAATKAVSRRDAGRIELTAVSGMRFFATGCLVCGRAIENLWIDEGTEGKLFSQTICSGLHTLANGVQVVLLHLPQLQTCSISIFVRCGSGHERRGRNGIGQYLVICFVT
jgi:hypothetical protein